MLWMQIVAIAFYALSSVADPALADQFEAPRLEKGPALSVQGYGLQNPDCLAWTNGCVLCRAGGTGHSQCSVTGIACQPAGITCKLLRAK